MKSKSQRGFSPIEIVLLVVIIGLVAFVAWYVFKSKSNTDNAYDNTPNSQSVPKETPKTSTNTQTSTTAIVVTKTDSNGKQYLADPNDKALYTYGADTSGVSNCTGDCVAAWPIYSAANAPSTLPANITVISRSDGNKQYAYKGKALYYYTADSAGSVSGNGVGGFNVATP